MVNRKLAILRLLLNEGGDLWTREIARKLGYSSSSVHGHLKGLVRMGVVKLNRVEHGNVTYAYYTPQILFTEDVNETLKLLDMIAKKVEGATDRTLANNIVMFLQCYNTL